MNKREKPCPAYLALMAELGWPEELQKQPPCQSKWQKAWQWLRGWFE